MQALTETPVMLPRGDTQEDAVAVLRDALGLGSNSSRSVDTPTGTVSIFERLLPHVVEKRLDGRERYAHFVLPTLESPTEIWQVAYDDDTTRRRYIKLFSGVKYDILVIVLENADGSVLWNVINRERKAMNTMRVGKLLFRADSNKGDTGD